MPPAGCGGARLRLRHAAIARGLFPRPPPPHIPPTPLPRRGPPPCRSAMGRQTKPKGVDPKLGAPELIKRLQVNRARTLPPRRQNTPRQPSRDAKSLAISGAQPHAGGSARPLSLSIHQGFWPWHRGAGGALLRWATRVRCATVCACRPMPTNGAERVLIDLRVVWPPRCFLPTCRRRTRTAKMPLSTRLQRASSTPA